MAGLDEVGWLGCPGFTEGLNATLACSERSASPESWLRLEPNHFPSDSWEPLVMVFGCVELSSPETPHVRSNPRFSTRSSGTQVLRGGVDELRQADANALSDMRISWQTEVQGVYIGLLEWSTLCQS